MSIELIIKRDKIILSADDGLHGINRESRDVIASSLSYKKDDYFFSEAYQSGRWSGVYELYHKRKSIDEAGITHFNGDGDWYSTGFLSRTIDSWKRVGASISDKRGVPNIFIDETKPSFTGLRQYQKEAVISLLSNQVDSLPIPRGIINLPPRTGKTRVAAGILDQIREARPAIFVVERIDLARQTVKALREVLDEPIGLVGDGEVDIQPITVITIQSLHMAFDLQYEKQGKAEYLERALAKKMPVVALVSKAQVFIVDEVHHVTALSYQKAIAKAINAWCIFGLSGSPWTDNGSDLLLESTVGPIIFERGHTYMVENGFLVPVGVFFFRLPKIYCYSGHFQAVYKAAVVDNPVKSYCIVNSANSLISESNSVAILTVQKQHAKDLAKQIDYEAVVLTGDERGSYRKDVYDKLSRKKIFCIVSTVFSEGIDVPSLNAGINADGGVDSRRAWQRLRMATPWVDPLTGKKKTRGIYIDFLHEEKHLLGHSQMRLGYYKSEPSFKVKILDYRNDLRVKFEGEVAFA